MTGELGVGDQKGSLTQANRTRVSMGREGTLVGLGGVRGSQGWSLAQPLPSGLPAAITCSFPGAQLPFLPQMCPVGSWPLHASFCEEYALLRFS